MESGMTVFKLCTMIYEANYVELRNWSYDDQDLLHDVYLKVYERLQNGAINTGKTINEAVKNVKNYFKKAIVNKRRLNGKQQKDFRDINEVGYLKQAEYVKQFENEIDKDDEVYWKQIKYHEKKVFQWLEKNEEPFEVYIIKLYYYSGLSYDQIAKLHNLKTWAVNYILKKLRSNIRKNLLEQIKMEELYNEVQEFISTPFTPDRFYVGLDLYKRVYPDKYKDICKGCRSKSIRIMQADFKTFLVINKEKVK